MSDPYITGMDAAAALDGTELLEVSQLSPTVTITAATISAQASDNSFNDSGSGFVAAGFAVDDRVQVVGFTGDVANNIFAATVTALAAGKMTIGGTDGDVIVDDAAGETVTITKWETRRSTAQDIGDLAGGGANEVVTILVSDPAGADITTGNGKLYYPVPASLAGLDLIDARAVLDTAGTGGGFLMQLRRKRSGSDVDMLSTRVSIDSGENDSEDATAPPVVDASNDDVIIGDRIYIDIDGVPTGAKGLVAELTFA
jgi:hypothetical protein